jgi:hypothetical protein
LKLRGRGFVVAADAGPGVAFLRIGGVALATTAEDHRIATAAVVALRLRLVPDWVVSPTVSAVGAYLASYALRVEPRGDVGRTPSVAATAGFGLAGSFP